MKVVIVGAGPAGLFAANELAEKADVVVIESRGYVGGSGLRSDGKLNFHPKIGGDLTEFMSEAEAEELLSYIEEILAGYGVKAFINTEKLEKLEEKAAKAGIRFIPIKQAHIGSDRLPGLMDRFRNDLEKKGVKFLLRTRAKDFIVRNGLVKGVITDKDVLECDYVLVAPGRIGSLWLMEMCRKYDIPMRHNPVDIGVRVEVPNDVMREIVYDYGCWDPKFHIYTPSYDDFVRTFCVCPSGFVVKESYGEGLFGVNGHSMWGKQSQNTNFAFIVRVALTEPLENTTEYGMRIAQLVNTLGGGRPIIQRLGDLKRRRRSTWARISRSHVEPTLKDVTPGDISMAYPSRILTDILEGLEALDRVIPGVYSNSTLLYAPEIKFYSMRIETDRSLRTTIPNMFVAGDGAGVSRGIVGAAATGIIAAKGIMASLH